MVLPKRSKKKRSGFVSRWWYHVSFEVRWANVGVRKWPMLASLVRPVSDNYLKSFLETREVKVQ